MKAARHLVRPVAGLAGKARARVDPHGEPGRMGRAGPEAARDQEGELAEIAVACRPDLDE